MAGAILDSELNSRPLRMSLATGSGDGHTAGIEFVVNQLLLGTGVEIINQGYNRTAEEIAVAAVQENVDVVCVSSYQGGHMHFFPYLAKLLKDMGSNAQIYVGGGGTITPEEIDELLSKGVAKVYGMGDQGFRDDIPAAERQPLPELEQIVAGVKENDHHAIGQMISAIEYAHEEGESDEKTAITSAVGDLRDEHERAKVIGVTGAGGAGKSTLVDELVLRYTEQYEDKRVAVISIDPSDKHTSLLGDRIRMNSLENDRIYMRSLGSRGAEGGLSIALEDSIDTLSAAGYDLIVVETVGVGQTEDRIAELSDVTVNVMTEEYGTFEGQAMKSRPLNAADLIVVNKSDKAGSELVFEEMTTYSHTNEERRTKSQKAKQRVFATCASSHSDEGTDDLFDNLMALTGFGDDIKYEPEFHGVSKIIDPKKQFYLGTAVDAIKNYNAFVQEKVKIAREIDSLEVARGPLLDVGLLKQGTAILQDYDRLIALKWKGLGEECSAFLRDWDGLVEKYKSMSDNQLTTFFGVDLHKVSLPTTQSYADRLEWILLENVPGSFPFTHGAYAFNRGEDIARQFTGLGRPKDTNKRMHELAPPKEEWEKNPPRASIAYDPFTLYLMEMLRNTGDFGKIGESGVNVSTLDDMKELFGGLPIGDGNMSTSHTINGPSSIVLAMFFNAAIDQEFEKYKARGNHTIERETVKTEVLERIKGTVQADILKEISQNSSIFPDEFALRLMGDVQEYITDNQMKFNSVSISGYHMAEAGATPIQQMAYTISNGLTYVEYFLSRGMEINDFASNLSFFFSSGMDEEYSAVGMVGRKIWSVIMRDVYSADEKGQKMRIHTQTSGRSLEAIDMDFNGIRTQAQLTSAMMGRTNSAHGNSDDEALTTPSSEKVRKALAIQKILMHEWGYLNLENVNSGSYGMKELSQAVEGAVLEEMSKLDRVGGVLGAMERGYQNRQIAAASARYEMGKKKHEEDPTDEDGRAVAGVTFYKKQDPNQTKPYTELVRCLDEHKIEQVERLEAFEARYNVPAPGQSAGQTKSISELALDNLKQIACDPNANIFAELMETTRVCSGNQIVKALYSVAGKHRRRK